MHKLSLKIEIEYKKVYTCFCFKIIYIYHYVQTQGATEKLGLNKLPIVINLEGPGRGPGNCMVCTYDLKKL